MTIVAAWATILDIQWEKDQQNGKVTVLSKSWSLKPKKIKQIFEQTQQRSKFKCNRGKFILLLIFSIKMPVAHVFHSCHQSPVFCSQCFKRPMRTASTRWRQQRETLPASVVWSPASCFLSCLSMSPLRKATSLITARAPQCRPESIVPLRKWSLKLGRGLQIGAEDNNRPADTGKNYISFWFIRSRRNSDDIWDNILFNVQTSVWNQILCISFSGINNESPHPWHTRTVSQSLWTPFRVPQQQNPFQHHYMTTHFPPRSAIRFSYFSTSFR